MPPDYNFIKMQFQKRSYIFTAHASERAIKRLIRSSEIEQAIKTGDVIEDYPNDKYGPSCLILGYTEDMRSLHIQVSYSDKVKIITVYEPSLDDWLEDLKTRRSHE